MASKTILMLAPIFIVLLASPACLGDSILYSGDTLHAGQYLSYGPYSFIIQNDCNLVLYDSGRPIWATNTGGLANDCHLTLEKDGDLVVYAPSNKIIWHSQSGTGQNGFYVLIVQKDRNVVIYGTARWATATNAANGAGPAQIYSTNTAASTTDAAASA